LDPYFADDPGIEKFSDKMKRTERILTGTIRSLIVMMI